MKGSFSTTEQDSEGVMEWNSVNERKKCRGSYEKVPECPEQFLVRSVSCFGVVTAMLPVSFSLSVSLHAEVREKTEGGQWSDGAWATDWGRGRWRGPRSTEGKKAEGAKGTLPQVSNVEGLPRGSEGPFDQNPAVPPSSPTVQVGLMEPRFHSLSNIKIH